MPRSCSICQHPSRMEIEDALLAGKSYRNVAARFETSVAALFRHTKKDLGEGGLIFNQKNQELGSGAGGTPENRTGAPRRYRCSRYHSHQIGDHVRFQGGFFETSDPTLQALIESNDWFGVHILEDRA